MSGHSISTIPQQPTGTEALEVDAALRKALASIGFDTEALETLEEALDLARVGGDIAFIDALRNAGYSDDAIKNALGTLHESYNGAPNSQMYSELFRAFASFKETATARLDALEERVTALEKTVAAISRKVPLWKWLLAFGVGVLVTFCLAAIHWNSSHTVIVTGNQQTDITQTSFGLQLFIGVCFFVLTMVVLVFIPGKPAKDSNADTTTTPQPASRRRRRSRS